MIGISAGDVAGMVVSNVAHCLKGTWVKNEIAVPRSLPSPLITMAKPAVALLEQQHQHL